MLAAERGWPPPEQWPTRNVYFGGVHAVRRDADGVDHRGRRRAGAAARPRCSRPDGAVTQVDSDPL